MIFITETQPSKAFSEKIEGICLKFREQREDNFVFLQNDGQCQPKIATMDNFGNILTKITQYRSKNIHDDVYSDEIRNCFPKEWGRKTIFIDKFVKKTLIFASILPI